MTTNTGATATYNLSRFDLELLLDTLRRNLTASDADVLRMTTELIDFTDTFLDATYTSGLHAVPIHRLGEAFGEPFAVRALGHIDDDIIAITVFVNPDADQPRLSWDIDLDDTTADEATIRRVRTCIYDAVRTAALLDQRTALNA
ncbi:hypothetical protein [Curtobacterium sp. MCSS17_016]|uniref:hypothetical protein n=1 Tax=Curtobacterium sp. MCSS17_016 TaxID=2175644 RepID=UPI000DAA029D|nr:hypothetical protein [Curtobacterium sp. MCSS17_016]WIE81442.1 hypothetical protein DEJ19_019595 [Curtobacterium sp. MCSS17_016]